MFDYFPVRFLAVVLAIAMVTSGCETEGERSESSEEPPSRSSMPLTVSPSSPALPGGPALPGPELELPTVSYTSEVVLGWGDGEGRVGLIPRSEERQASGPQSLTVALDGSIWLLDQVNNRLVHLAPNGGWLGSVDSPTGATDVAVGLDGALYVLSIINRQVTVIGGDGTIETVQILGPFRTIAGITIDRHDQLLLINAYQESFNLGSRGAWIRWPEIVHTKVEGIPGRSGGPYLRATLYEGQAALVHPSAPNTALDIRTLEDSRDAASVVVLDSRRDGGAAVLLEWLSGSGDSAITRTIREVDGDGRLISEELLPPAGIAFPFREWAAGYGGSLHQLDAQPDGLHLRSYALATEQGE